jgi:hypothetical protein
VRRVVALLSVLALAACSGQSAEQKLFDDAVVSGSEAVLGDAVAAFFVGPQTTDLAGPFAEGNEPGYLVLVDPSGAFRTVRTARMEALRPAWSSHGLYFADEDNDYRLTSSGLTTIENPKAISQNLMIALPDGGAVGVYNAGLGNEVSTPDGTLYSVTGNYFTGAACDGQVYGIAEEHGSQLLDRVYPAGQAIARVPLDTTAPIGTVPCHDGVITFLSWDRSAGRATVADWNTTTGVRQERPVTFGDGTTIAEASFGYAVQDWKEGALHWVDGDGRVFSTDSATGATAVLFETGLATGPGRDRHTVYDFTDTRLHTISSVRDAAGNLTYTVFDRADGSRVQEVPVPIPNTGVNISHLGLTYMAARD